MRGVARSGRHRILLAAEGFELEGSLPFFVCGAASSQKCRDFQTAVQSWWMQAEVAGSPYALARVRVDSQASSVEPASAASNLAPAESSTEECDPHASGH
jgi:hypothetical protein